MLMLLFKFTDTVVIFYLKQRHKEKKTIFIKRTEICELNVKKKRKKNARKL